MGLFKKKDKTPPEPQYYLSATNIPTYNYRVYYMKPLEKILYFLLAFVIGAIVGYVFYGGLGKDEFGQATRTTYIMNITIPSIVGIIAGFYYVPARTKTIIANQKRELGRQFRDMLDALNTSIGAGKNVNDAFMDILEDLKVQYDEDAFIIKEVQVIIAGIQNNVAVEDVLDDFGIRSDNEDIRSFASVFRISYQKGGNMKDIITNTHSVLTDKMEIREDIETLLTSNKMEQNIMAVMPVGIVGMIKMMSPEFAENFAKPSGIATTTVCIVVFVIAYLIGKAVMDIKV